MHQAVDSGACRHRIFEDGFPLAEWKVAREHHAPSLVTFRQQREQHLHLFTALLNVADVINDDRVKAREPFQQAAQLQVSFGDQQFLNQQAASSEVHLAAQANQFLTDSGKQMRLPSARVPKNQDVLATVKEPSFRQRANLSSDFRR